MVQYGLDRQVTDGVFNVHPPFVCKAALANALAAFLSVYSVHLHINVPAASAALYSGIVWIRSTEVDAFYLFGLHSPGV